jgi:hypothetical protein
MQASADMEYAISEWKSAMLRFGAVCNRELVSMLEERIAKRPYMFLGGNRIVLFDAGDLYEYLSGSDAFVVMGERVLGEDYDAVFSISSDYFLPDDTTISLYIQFEDKNSMDGAVYEWELFT